MVKNKNNKIRKKTFKEILEETCKGVPQNNGQTVHFAQTNPNKGANYSIIT